MESPDLGPAGCWYAVFVFAIIGGIASIIGIILGIIWLFNHLIIK